MWNLRFVSADIERAGMGKTDRTLRSDKTRLLMGLLQSARSSSRSRLERDNEKNKPKDITDNQNVIMTALLCRWNTPAPSPKTTVKVEAAHAVEPVFEADDDKMAVAPNHHPPVAQIGAPSTAEPSAAVTADRAPQEPTPGYGRRVPSQRTVVVKRRAQDAARREKEQELKKLREVRKKDQPAPGHKAAPAQGVKRAYSELEAVDEVLITKKPRRRRKRRPFGGRRKTAKKNGTATRKPAPAAKTRAKNPARSSVLPPVPATVLGLVDVDGVRRSARLKQHQPAQGSVVPSNPPRCKNGAQKSAAIKKAEPPTKLAARSVGTMSKKCRAEVPAIAVPKGGRAPFKKVAAKGKKCGSIQWRMSQRHAARMLSGSVVRFLSGPVPKTFSRRRLRGRKLDTMTD